MKALGAVLLVVALSATGAVGYAASAGSVSECSSASAGYGNLCAQVDLVWTGPVSSSPSASWVGCDVDLSPLFLRVSAENLAPGDSCGVSATLLNLGEKTLGITETVTLIEPKACSLFAYSDNLPSSPYLELRPLHTFSYQGRFSLSTDATNACEGAGAVFLVEITGSPSSSCQVSPEVDLGVDHPSPEWAC